MQILNWVLGGALVAVIALFSILIIIKDFKYRASEKNRRKMTQELSQLQSEVVVDSIPSEIKINKQVTMMTKEEGPITPGEYIVLSLSENEKSFDMIVGKSLKNYNHGDTIAVADGDEIAPISCDVLLRRIQKQAGAETSDQNS